MAWRPNNGIAAYGPIDTAHPPIARSPGLVTGTISPAVAAGTNKTITLTALSTAGYFNAPGTLILTQGANIWTLTGCDTARTETQFTCATIAPSHAGTTTAFPITVSGTVATADGNVAVTTQTTANWVNNALTLTVGSTMAFGQNSFWLGSDLITCSGLNNALQLTGCNVPTAIVNNATLTTSARSNAGTGTIGGFIKIERQAANGTWNDVTMEILNYGIAGPNIVGGAGGANAGGTACADPTPNAIVRIQRLSDNNWTSCAPRNNVSTDFWPNTLYDTRESIPRDVAPAGNALAVAGVMHYVTIDVQNLSQWFKGAGAYAASTGIDSKLDNNGYTLYFSDRRNNRNALNQETGDYGFEDFVNPTVASGAPNGVLDTGEDVNANGTLDVYGATPSYNGTYNSAPPGSSVPLTTAATPATTLTRGDAQVNRAIFFRRALKLTRGSNIAGFGVTGLTVVSENPVYVQGDWNATGGNFNGAHAATSVMADAVTLLSNSWNDITSFTQPYAVGNRNRGTQTWYRLAIISGKGIHFPQPAGTGTDFGTDGGAHNFLRYLENGDQAVNYTGSMATFFYNRQAVGTFKCCATVYGAPARNYAFDTDFLNPALLPPNTPMFRDLNAVGFAQELRPGR
jgi:hypothetical protein